MRNGSRLKPKRTLPLLRRIQPVERELFRSYLARQADAASAHYVSFLKELGFQITSRPPAWCGVQLKDIEAQQLAVLTRHSPDTLMRLQLDVERSPFPTSVKHPSSYRGCAQCQVEDGAWRKWNGDPLHIVCPIHHTIMWNEGPHGRTLRDDHPFKEHEHRIEHGTKWEWHELLQTATAETSELANLQATLTKARHDHPEIDPLFTKLIVAYRRAVEHNADAAILTDHFQHGWEVLAQHEREQFNPQQTTKLFKAESIWTRVEDLVAIYHRAVPEVIAQAKGNASRYKDLFDDLYELGPMKRISTRGADNTKGAVISGPLRAKDINWSTINYEYITPELETLFCEAAEEGLIDWSTIDHDYLTPTMSFAHWLAMNKDREAA